MVTKEMLLEEVEQVGLESLLLQGEHVEGPFETDELETLWLDAVMVVQDLAYFLDLDNQQQP